MLTPFNNYSNNDCVKYLMQFNFFSAVIYENLLDGNIFLHTFMSISG